MKVFIVFDEDDPYCGAGYLHGVFSSLDLAKEYIKKYENSCTNFYIDEQEVLNVCD